MGIECYYKGDDIFFYDYDYYCYYYLVIFVVRFGYWGVDGFWGVYFMWRDYVGGNNGMKKFFKDVLIYGGVKDKVEGCLYFV